MRVFSSFSSDRNFSSSPPSLSQAQIGIDSLQSGFVNQATNLNFLTAMTAASGAFSLGRVLGASLFSSVLGGVTLRAASWSVGFLGEVAIFRRVNQALNPETESWSDSRSFMATAADFLLLKGAGVLLGGNPYLVRLSGQATAMVAGEYVGEVSGLRESTERNFAERYANALATGVAMEIGGHLIRISTGTRFQMFEESLERSHLHLSMEPTFFNKPIFVMKSEEASRTQKPWFEVLNELRNTFNTLKDKNTQLGFRWEIESSFFDQLLDFLNPPEGSYLRRSPSDIPHELANLLNVLKDDLVKVTLKVRSSEDPMTAFGNHQNHRNELLNASVNYLISRIEDPHMVTAQRDFLRGKLLRLAEQNNRLSLTRMLVTMRLWTFSGETCKGVTEALLSGINEIVIHDPRYERPMVVKANRDIYGIMSPSLDCSPEAQIPSID